VWLLLRLRRKGAIPLGLDARIGRIENHTLQCPLDTALCWIGRAGNRSEVLFHCGLPCAVRIHPQNSTLATFPLIHDAVHKECGIVPCRRELLRLRPMHEAVLKDTRHVVCSMHHFDRKCLPATHKHSQRRGMRSGALRMVTLHRAESQPGVHPSQSGFIPTRTRGLGGSSGRYEL